MTAPGAVGDDEFLLVACEALRRPGRGDPLDRLGWWGLLADLDDADTRAAALTLFRAQGRELTTSGALGGLLAHPFVGADVADGAVAGTVARTSPTRGPVLVLVGPPPSEALLVDRPGAGASLVAVADVRLHPVVVPGRLLLHEVELDGSDRPTIGEERALTARGRSRFLGRVALAFEILGAAERALALAVEHAGAREQFGRPIGTFQAVRHLLAQAQVDVAAGLAVADQAVVLDRAAPERFDDVTKALAGRNGRLVCERALQAFGGIGFTAEHDHHHLHSRVLALDGLLGSSVELTRGLGEHLRTTGSAPQVPARVLAGGAPG